MGVMASLLGTACAQTAAAGAQAGQQSSAPQPALKLPSRQSNQDAVYQSIMAARQQQLSKLTPVTDAMLRHPSGVDWLSWRRTEEGLGFSPLHQIDRQNAGSLRVAWSWSLAVSLDEITPLVHDGVLFIQSANKVQAFDAASGDLLWAYTRNLTESLYNGKYSSVKNPAIYQDKLFCPMPDGHLVALDVHSGKVLWDHAVLSPEETKGGAHISGGPLVAHGKVITGVTFCIASKGGCFIVALDAQTGEESWRFNTIARPGQPGGDSWNVVRPSSQRYGAAVWTSGSYDPDLNLVYFGTGQTYDTSTLLDPHPGKGESSDALYTDSTVAINPDTGKLVWYYQHMQRDVWDLDWAFEQSLIDLPIYGTTKKLLVTGGKIAIFDAVDRADGQYVFSKDLGVQNIVTAIDPKTGHKTISPAFAPEANQTKLLCPSAGGGRNWPATAYDPATKILYVPLVESCADFTWIPRGADKTIAGGDWIFTLWTGRGPTATATSAGWRPSIWRRSGSSGPTASALRLPVPCW